MDYALPDPERYIEMPDSVSLSPDLPPVVKTIYGVLLALAEGAPYVEADVPTIAAFTPTHPRTAARALATLAKVGLITIDPGAPDQLNRYTITEIPLQR